MAEIERITLSLKGGAYPLTIGIDIAQELVAIVGREAAGRRVAIITDDKVKKLRGAQVRELLSGSGVDAELFSFAGGEASKNQASVTALQHALLEKKYGRDTLVVTLGGGVAGDLGGFVAATYMRGIPYIQIPTTLLAMVDASVGGKVGIDTPYGKNTIGAFWQPKAVHMDLRYLEGLPKREIVNGLLEAVKSFITSDAASLPLADELDLDEPLRTPETLREIVARSVRFKAGVTERDEREEGERMVLNFGHTVGHAIELLSEFSIPHGFAVGYGMLVEARISELCGHLEERDRASIKALFARLGVDAKPLREFSFGDILEAMNADKKTRGGKPHFVLLERIGGVRVVDGAYAHAVPADIVASAWESTVKSS